MTDIDGNNVRHCRKGRQPSSNFPAEACTVYLVWLDEYQISKDAGFFLGG